MLVVSIFVSFNKNQRTETEWVSMWYIVFSSTYTEVIMSNFLQPNLGLNPKWRMAANTSQF